MMMTATCLMLQTTYPGVLQLPIMLSSVDALSCHENRDPKDGLCSHKCLTIHCLRLAAACVNAGNTLEGFGIVTLASLLPVLAVELMAVITSAQ
jgi:hypothetical protein